MKLLMKELGHTLWSFGSKWRILKKAQLLYLPLLLSCFPQSIYSLSCGYIYQRITADTIDRERKIIDIYSDGGTITVKLDSQSQAVDKGQFVERLSPEILMNRLVKRFDSASMVFVGTIDTVIDISVGSGYFYENHSIIGINIDKVLKGAISVSRHWEEVGGGPQIAGYHKNYESLQKTRAIWFFKGPITSLLNSSFHPAPPCGRGPEGNPINSADMVSEYGYNFTYGVSVPLESYLAKITSTNVGIKSHQESPLKDRSKTPVNYFRLPGSRSILSADGKRISR